MYPDEVLVYLKKARKNKLEDEILDLLITSNPHTKDPNSLLSQMRATLKAYDENQELDREGLKRLKGRIFIDRKLRKK